MNYHIMTFGCQMNVHDSEKMAGYLENLGYRNCNHPETADLLLVNTCSVREKADHKAFSLLGTLKGLKAENPERILVLCGCIAQLQGKEILRRAPYVDIVLGAQNLSKLPELVKQRQKYKSALLEVTDNRTEKGFSLLPPPEEAVPRVARGDRVKAWVTVVEGCDKFCSYCVVPYARGRERSRPYQDIEKEVAGLAEQGYKEVTLLGQNVNSYGKNSPHGLAFLLDRLNRIEKIKRIRFVTSNPVDFDGNLVRAVTSLEKVCEHVHLPVQSGSDRILKLMNRRYTADQYLKKIEPLIKTEAAITSDIMVGFPGETENDFRETLDLIEQAKFDNFYPFIYCDRPRARAAGLPGKVSKEVSRERFGRLEAVLKELFKQVARKMMGKRVEVLVEGPSRSRPEYLTGRTRTNRIVHFKGDLEMIGQLKMIQVEEALGSCCRGTVI